LVSANPEGVAASSPAVAVLGYPGFRSPCRFQPQRGCGQHRLICPHWWTNSPLIFSAHYHQQR